ncbi:MAG: TIGR04255 family protein [Thermoanaerobaculia bacterium]|jgi:uncharacterized protein (TIGR04255 family)|nr:TIGR04255 family protein [Thermoanaerobaculia bacterium]
MSDSPYPNAPVREVVFEIRFPGEPAVECRRDKLFELVRQDFPNVQVPAPGPAVAGHSALLPYKFAATNGSRSLLCALNLFAFSSSLYPGFRPFRDEALRYLGLFQEVVPLGRLSRTGLRYVNVIPLPPGSPVHELLDVSLSLGSYTPGELRNLALSLEIPRPSGTLTMRLGPLAGSDQPMLVLDFDYAKTGDLDVAHLPEYLQESHDETKRLFEGLITQSYRAYLEGEVVA